MKRIVLFLSLSILVNACTQNDNYLVIKNRSTKKKNTILHYFSPKELESDSTVLTNCYCFTNDTTTYIHISENSDNIYHALHIELDEEKSYFWIHQANDIKGSILQLQQKIACQIDHNIIDQDVLFGEININQHPVWRGENDSIVFDAHSMGTFQCTLMHRNKAPDEFKSIQGGNLYNR